MLLKKKHLKILAIFSLSFGNEIIVFLFLPNHYHLESQLPFDCSRFFVVYLVNKDFLQMRKNQVSFFLDFQESQSF